MNHPNALVGLILDHFHPVAPLFLTTVHNPHSAVNDAVQSADVIQFPRRMS